MVTEVKRRRWIQKRGAMTRVIMTLEYSESLDVYFMVALLLLQPFELDYHNKGIFIFACHRILSGVGLGAKEGRSSESGPAAVGGAPWGRPGRPSAVLGPTLTAGRLAGTAASDPD